MFEATMKPTAISILMYGRDANLMQTRQWVLQSRGYRVLVITHPAGIETTPLAPPIALLIFCHSISPEERAATLARATSRWPAIKHLVLDVEASRNPGGILGQLLHTMGGPQNLLAMVGKLVGQEVSIPDSRIY
jgi:hypothetical protein